MPWDLPIRRDRISMRRIIWNRGQKTTGDGWLNRALPPEKTSSPVRAVSLGPELPHALRGHNEAVAIDNLSDFKVRDTRGASALERMYAGTQDQFLNGT